MTAYLTGLLLGWMVVSSPPNWSVISKSGALQAGGASDGDESGAWAAVEAGRLRSACTASAQARPTNLCCCGWIIGRSDQLRGGPTDGTGCATIGRPG